MTRPVVHHIALFALLAGCGERPDDGPCELVPIAISDHELTPGGFSVNDMLAVSTGIFAEQATLVDGTESALTVRSWRGEDSAELVRSTRRPARLRAGVFQVESSFIVCTDFVRVPLGVELTTPSGEVDLSAEAFLTRPLEPRDTFTLSATESTFSADLDDEVQDYVVPEPVEHDPAEMDRTSESARLRFDTDAREGVVSWNGWWTSELGRHSSGERLVDWDTRPAP